MFKLKVGRIIVVPNGNCFISFNCLHNESKKFRYQFVQIKISSDGSYIGAAVLQHLKYLCSGCKYYQQRLKNYNLLYLILFTTVVLIFRVLQLCSSNALAATEGKM